MSVRLPQLGRLNDGPRLMPTEDEHLLEGDLWCRRTLGVSLPNVVDLLAAGTWCSSARAIVAVPHGVGLSLIVSGVKDGDPLWERKLKLVPGERIISERVLVHPAHRLQGTGSILNRNLHRLATLANLHVVEARASTPAGSYFCVRCGFLPAPEEWPALRRQLRTRLDLVAARHALPEAAVTFLRRLLTDGPPGAARALLGLRELLVPHLESGKTVPLGRALLEAPLRTWRAVLDFRDPEVEAMLLGDMGDSEHGRAKLPSG